MRRLHSRIRLAVSTAVVALCGTAMLGTGAPLVASGSTVSASVWLQTMDSCKQALGDAQYQVVGDGGVDMTVTTAPATKQSLSSSNCPLQQGDCSSMKTGCLQITGLAPGSYRIHETRTPKPDTSNPEGYAACNGGSACQRQEIALTISSSGTASARVTNVYPDGTVAVYPSGKPAYAGTTKDPIVVHNFGLAKPGKGGVQCDGDSDADDHLTGSPSSRCAYPEGQESSACMPFPWSCTLAPWTVTTTSTTTSSTTTDSSSTTTSTTDTTTSTGTTTTTTTTDTTTSTDTTTTDTTTSSTTTTTTTTTAACGITGTSSGKLKKGTTKKFSMTAAAGTLHTTVSWSPAATVRLRVVDPNSKVIAETTTTAGTALSLDMPALQAGRYSLQLKLSGVSSVMYTLAATHC